MRDHFRVCPRFWTGGTGRRIVAAGPDPVILALYLMTSPHAHGAGLYYLPLAYAAHETQRPEASLKAAMVILSEVDFCLYDFASELVLVFEMASHQIGEVLKDKDLRRKFVVTQLDQFRGHPFVGRFLDRYAKPYGISRDPFEGVSKGSRRGLENPSKRIPVRIAEKREGEGERDREGERESAPLEPPSTEEGITSGNRGMNPTACEFQTAWKAAGLPMENWHPGRDAALWDAQTRPFFRERWRDGIAKASKIAWRKFTVEQFLREGELERILEGERDDRGGGATSNSGTKKIARVDDLDPDLRETCRELLAVTGQDEAEYMSVLGPRLAHDSKKDILDGWRITIRGTREWKAKLKEQEKTK